MPKKMSKWKQTHLEKYGGEEGLKAEMARRRTLNTATPYYATLSKEKLSEFAYKSHESRNKKGEKQKATPS